MRLINYDALLEAINKNPASNPNFRCAQLLEAILNAPTLDPVVHAQWVLDASFFNAHVYHCSMCNRKQMQTSKFCPECGAQMDEVVET